MWGAAGTVSLSWLNLKPKSTQSRMLSGEGEHRQHGLPQVCPRFAGTCDSRHNSTNVRSASRSSVMHPKGLSISSSEQIQFMVMVIGEKPCQSKKYINYLKIPHSGNHAHLDLTGRRHPPHPQVPALSSRTSGIPSLLSAQNVRCRGWRSDPASRVILQ